MENQNPTQTPVSGSPATTPSGPEPLKWEQFQPHIPKEYQESGLWEPLKNNPAMIFKNYAEAQKRLGNSISLPTEADPEAWGKIYNKLGRPETPEKYAWDAPEHTSIEWNQELLDGMKAHSHKLGLSQSQYKDTMDFYATSLMNQVNAENQAAKAHNEKVETQLKESYGTNYEFNKQLGLRAATEYFGAEVAKEMGDLMSSNPDLFKGLFKLGQEMNEAGTFGSMTPSDFGGLTYESAQEKISELNQADKSTHPYWNASHPDHSMWVQKALKYFQVPKPRV